MYVDLAINETGDLLFEEKPKISFPTQKIQFNLSKNSRAVKINFALSCESQPIQSNNSLKISFNIQESNQIIASTCKNNELIAQMIRNILQTDLYELPERQDFGSKANSYKHMNINGENIKNFKSYLSSVLSNYILNPEIEIYPTINETNGYMQTLHVDVYSNNSLIFMTLVRNITILFQSRVIFRHR